MQLFQLQQQLVKRGAGRGIEKALSQGISTDRAPFAQHRRNLGRVHGHQLNHLPHRTLAILAQAGLGGDQLDKYLGAAQQFFSKGNFALQR